MHRTRCLTSARFTMTCDIIKPYSAPENQPTNDPTGVWVYKQDEDSGAIIRVWVDDPATIEDESRTDNLIIHDVSMIARSVMTKGFNGASSMEKFSEVYDNIDWITATFSKNVNVTKRDRIYNIRSRDGQLVWKEEEMSGSPATVFDVMGVTPILGPFNRHIENTVLLRRSEVQSAP